MTVEEAKSIVLKEFPTASFLKVDIRFKDKARKYKHPEFMRAYDFLRKNDICTAITIVDDRNKFIEFTSEIEPDSDVESEQNQETISEPEPKRTIKPEDKPKRKAAPRRCVVEKLRFDNKVLQNIVMQYCEEIGRLNDKIDNLIETNDYNFGNYLIKREECASLRKELANHIVDKVNEQALHSAESALAYKENVISEKDDVIEDLGKELAAIKKELEEKTKLVEMVRKGSKEYCEYGIAAEKMIQKLAKIIVGKGSVTSEDFEKCRRWAKGYRFNPQLPKLSEEEEEKLQHAKKYRVSYDKAKKGGDQSVVTIVQCDNGITLSKEEVEIIERCTKNGMELHYSEKDGLTYTNMFGEEIPIICLRGMFHIFTDEKIKNMKK